MGFGFETTTDEVLAGVDLTGRTALVTGASAGIGVETARALAAAGASVTMTGRDPGKLAAAAASVREGAPGADVATGELDLASLASVRAFAADWLAGHDRLHLLVANAGVMFAPEGRTDDGFEIHLGTNHLGHFLLTGLLLPALLADPPARVVALSSGGHAASGIVWDDPMFDRRPYDKMQAYGQSKTANVLFALELDRRLAGRGVHAYSVHPGMITTTDLGRTMTRDDYRSMVDRAKANPSGGGLPPAKTEAQGAATTVWAAVAPELDAHGGAYLADCAVAQPAAWASDPDAAARLWALSEELVGEPFPA
jgi:NAD(P)-dependent dehydrogenase (short-subunit alcohol dehydrogenase family)